MLDDKSRLEILDFGIAWNRGNGVPASIVFRFMANVTI